MTGHVQDLWMRPGPNGRKVRSERHGHGKRWQARWVEVGREKAKSFISKDAAERHLALVEVHGPFTPRPRTTFGEYANTWRQSQLHHRANTADNTEGIFRLMLDPQLGRIPLVEVTRTDVQNAVVEWRANYSAARVRLAYGYTATVYKSAVLDGLVDANKNPCQRISLPEVEAKKVIPLTVDQVKTIHRQIVPHLASMVVVDAASGLRIGELGGLTYDRILNRALRVDRQLIGTKDGAPVWGPPKTPSSDRTVPIGDVAWRALSEHMDAHPDNPYGLVWVGPQGGPLVRSRAGEAWRGAAAGMNLWPRAGFHDLRHFHASLLIARGLSPRAVADRLGHKDPSITLSVYSHLWGDDQARATNATDEMLGDL